MIFKFAIGNVEMLNGIDGPFGGYALGMSVAECTTQTGLLVTDVVEMGNAAMSGIEKGDTIIAINGQVPWRVNSVADATFQQNTDRLTLRVVAKNREQYEFAFPIPLRQPEVHFCGLLFEKESVTGQFVVSGCVRGSEAAKLHFPVGSILSTVHDVPITGKSDSEVRKLLFGRGGDTIQIGSQPPGWPTIIDVQFPRFNHLRQIEPTENYCDGWSEKAFDEEYCCAKASNWLESNPPHLAEHRYEDDQILCLHEERFQASTITGDHDFDSNLRERANIPSHLAAWLQDAVREFRDRQAANDHQIEKAIADATLQISGTLSTLEADFEQRRRDRAQYRELTQQVENLQKTLALLQAVENDAVHSVHSAKGSNGFGKHTA